MKSRNLFVLSALAMLALTSCGGQQSSSTVNPTTDEQPDTTIQPTTEKSSDDRTESIDSSDMPTLDPTTEESSKDETTEEESTKEESSEETSEETSEEESSAEESSSIVEISANDARSLNNRLGELGDLYTFTVTQATPERGTFKYTGSNFENLYYVIDDVVALVRLEDHNLYQAEFNAQTSEWEFSYDFGYTETFEESYYRSIENLNEEEFVYDADNDTILLNDAEQMMYVIAGCELDYALEDLSAIEAFAVDATVKNQLTFTALDANNKEICEILFEADEYAGSASLEDWLDTNPEQKGSVVSYEEMALALSGDNMYADYEYYIFESYGAKVFSENAMVEDYGNIFDDGSTKDIIELFQLGFLNITEEGKVLDKGCYSWEWDNGFDVNELNFVSPLEGLVYAEEDADESHALVEAVSESTYQDYAWNPTLDYVGFAAEVEETYGRDVIYPINGAYVIDNSTSFTSGYGFANYIAACFLHFYLGFGNYAMWKLVDRVEITPFIGEDGQLHVDLWMCVDVSPVYPQYAGIEFWIEADIYDFNSQFNQIAIAEDFIANLPDYEEPTSEESSIIESSEESSVIPGSSEESSSVAVEPTKASVSIEQYAADNEWDNGTQYKEVAIDENIIADALPGSASNTGKYYTKNNSWRFYQNEKAQLNIGAAEGYEILSVKITYDADKGGVLLLNDNQIASGAEVENINDSSITFGVDNTGSATNGNIQITKIEVTYVAK